MKRTKRLVRECILILERLEQLNIAGRAARSFIFFHPMPCAKFFGFFTKLDGDAGHEHKQQGRQHDLNVSRRASERCTSRRI